MNAPREASIVRHARVAFADRFDSLIAYHCTRLAVPWDWRLTKAQVGVESAFKPDAVSRVGAQGLLQLMPATDRAIDGDLDGFAIEGNLDNGLRYLLDQYDRLVEIPDTGERLKCALAAYNGGRGYVNAALKLAYETEHREPMDYAALKPGAWSTWAAVARGLADVRCVVMGHHPDWQQITDYVDRVWSGYQP